MVEFCGLTLILDDGDLVALDADGFEVGRTTLANGIMQSEQVWHFTREAARVDALVSP